MADAFVRELKKLRLSRQADFNRFQNGEISREEFEKIQMEHDRRYKKFEAKFKDEFEKMK